MGRRRKGRAVSGWLALDKPIGMTSTQALGKARWLFGAAKAGHGGTLDPLASGLLPIAFGEACKTVNYAMQGRKVYRFTIAWGAQTSTDDTEGEIIAASDKRPSLGEIEAVLPRFRGCISQVPPQFSALKVDGARAYDLARQGEHVELAARQVDIDSLTLVDMPDADHCRLEAVCGKGTYVRALARDIALALGTCGHVTSLRRVAVGAFAEADMISLEVLQEMRHIGAPFEEFDRLLKPVATVLDDIPALAVNKMEAARLKQGQPVFVHGQGDFPVEGTVYAQSHGVPVAIAEMREGLLHPLRVFNLPV
ncbi:MAG: tRNA pseudouridine(55) synthase TruB [Hyphomicrobiales bacterium]|nr:MAG: tRNA pseudouridine(55) synthase TruB [Hyphomicrobiales bacterium]